MNIKKPNSFARYGADYVAPLTTIDQIVKPSGERYTDKEFELMSNVENVMFGENSAGKNLLKPTLETTTQNGVTCTNNGDGTYTLNGMASGGNAVFVLVENDRNLFEQVKGKTLKFICCENGSSNTYFGYVYALRTGDIAQENKEGVTFTAVNDYTDYNLTFQVYNGHTVNNLIIKPMLTTDLSATYDDFEPYVKSLKQLTDSALNMDLLWTNASPTGLFAAQTISLGIDLSQYKYLLFEWHEFVSYYSKFYSEIIGYNKGIVSIATGERRYREYSVTTENSISFESAYSNGATTNNHMIPMRIFGVK